MVQLNQLLLKELAHEANSTRKILAVVPEDKMDWQPHEKSMTLGRLASHIAELPIWLNRALNANGFDMAELKPADRITCRTNKELMEFFESRLQPAVEALEKLTNEELSQEWVLRRGDFIISKGTKHDAVRNWMMNHQVHHRGQLSVYLRMLNIPIPGMYGPSADDIEARKKAEAAKA